MAAEPDEFQIYVVQNCPSDGAYYYLLRYGQNNELIRFPLERALRIRGPFEHPIGCKPGCWLVIFTSDHLGHTKIQHIGGRSHVEVRLSLPQSVCEAAGAPADNEKLMDILTKPAEEEDDEEGSLKATRIEAKKREIALDLANKQDKLLRRTGRSKELTEGFMLNREHRLEVRAQSEAMFRIQNQSAAMMERNFVLMEKMQEVFGRFAELEKAAAQKMASPPPPPDYTPVLSSVVTAIRDIGVSALQRDEKRKLTPDEESSQLRASLADNASGPVQADERSSHAASLSIASTRPHVSQKSKAQGADLSALQRIEAERDRLKSELEAERKRQGVLDELSAGSPESRLPRRPSRNTVCPCGSGRRYSRCCGRKGRQPVHAQASKPTMQRHSVDQRPDAKPASPIASTVGMPQPTASPSHPKASKATAQRHSVDQRPDAAPASPIASTVSAPPPTASPSHPQASKATTRQHSADQRPDATPASLIASTINTPPPTALPSHPQANNATAQRLSVDQRPDAAPASPIASTVSMPQPASALIGHETEARAVPAASAVEGTASQPASSPSEDPPLQTPPVALPPDEMREEMRELLVNVLAGKMLTDADAPIPPPLVSQVKQVEAVLVAPPKMDRETALRLLKDGSMLEAFGAFLFFNPALRTALLSRSGK